MPLFTTNTSIVEPCPLQMRVEFAHPDLVSTFGRLAVQPGQACANQIGYKSALSVAQAVRAVELSYAGLPKRHLQTLRSFVERTIRHARLFTAAAENRETGDCPWRQRELLTQLEHSIQMMRREVVRAMRYEQLELRYPTGETSRPNKRTLKGTKSGLTSFVNRVCYAVTLELGCFALPLLPLAPKCHVSDTKVDSFWDPAGLGIWWDDQFGWIVESIQGVGTSEVSTEVEEGRMAEDEEESEEDGGQPTGIGGDYNEAVEGHVCADGSTCEGSVSDISMGDEPE